MNNIERRLSRLEQATSADERPFVYFWQEGSETEAEAEARYFREHPEERGARVILIRWRRPGDPDTPSGQAGGS